MKWPWISRKRHEALLDAKHRLCVETVAAALAKGAALKTDVQAELEQVQRCRIAAENEAAKLRGQLVAERHRQGLPASVGGDAA